MPETLESWSGFTVDTTTPTRIAQRTGMGTRGTGGIAYVPPARFAEIARRLVAGESRNSIVRKTVRTSFQTVAKVAALLAARGTPIAPCACGRPKGHGGWCRPKARANPARLAKLCRLTPAQTAEIRARYAGAPKVTLAALGREYGVTYTTIRAIVRGARWTR